MPMSDASADSLVAAAREMLLRHGPMSEDALLDALTSGGTDLVPALDRSLIDVLDDHLEPVHVLADDRLAWIPQLLDGRIFTHRLTPVEAEHDAIPWQPDLAPLSLLTAGAGYQQLADGSPISEAFAELGDDFATRTSDIVCKIFKGSVFVKKTNRAIGEGKNRPAVMEAIEIMAPLVRIIYLHSTRNSTC
jgi:hypothetical protein